MRLAQIRNRLHRLRGKDRLLLLEAAACLGIARIAVLALPLRWLVPPPRPGTAPERRAARAPDRGAVVPSTLHGSAERVGRAVVAMSRHTPWQSRCLVQAIAARWMLRRRGVPSILHLGVTRGTSASPEPVPLPDQRGGGHAHAVQAHAWLTCDDIVVTGGPHANRYTLLATFADDLSGASRGQPT